MRSESDAKNEAAMEAKRIADEKQRLEEEQEEQKYN